MRLQIALDHERGCATTARSTIIVLRFQQDRSVNETMVKLQDEDLRRIFAYLTTATGQSSLVAASHVSRDWRTSAQSQLFRIAWIKSAKNMRNFIRAIQTSEGLRAHVKEVRLAGSDANASVEAEAKASSLVDCSDLGPEDCANELVDLFSLGPQIEFASLLNMYGAMDGLPLTLKSVDLDSQFGIEVEFLFYMPEQAEDLWSEHRRPAIERCTMRGADLGSIAGQCKFVKTLQLFPNITSLRLIDVTFEDSTSADETSHLLFAADGLLSLIQPTFQQLKHFVYHDNAAAGLSQIFDQLDSLVSLTLPVLCLCDDSIANINDKYQRSTLLSHVTSPSFVTLRLLRHADTPPPDASTAIELCAKIGNCIALQRKGLRKVCIDYSYWPGRKVLIERCAGVGVRVVWGIFVTADEEWKRAEWGSRLPDLME